MVCAQSILAKVLREDFMGHMGLSASAMTVLHAKDCGAWPSAQRAQPCLADFDSEDDFHRNANC